MSYDVRLESSGGSHLAVVRRVARLSELPAVVPAACGTVWDVLRSRQISGAGRNITIYWDDRINLEVGVEMNSPFAGQDEVVGSITPTGTVAAATHFGPYHLLPAAHQAIREWCAGHGRAPAGPNWEIYGHWSDEWNADPSQIRTDVYYLLL